MTYLLDTNACIAYLNDANSAVAQRLRLTKPAEVFLCQIVKAELYFGAYKSSRRQANLALLDQFCGLFASLPFDDRAVRQYGQLRARLTAQGNLIGPNDLIIAAIAVAHQMILVTQNVREFTRVDGLRFEDWSDDET